jgi:hypothetical protein
MEVKGREVGHRCQYVKVELLVQVPVYVLKHPVHPALVFGPAVSLWHLSRDRTQR